MTEIATGLTRTRIWWSGLSEVAQRQSTTHILVIKRQVSLFMDVDNFS